ncbi:MAG TPA: serine/threonine-protein kinase, partial [Gammaproteobacteria bacterium]|nr:serine/threonine-protein kinase [Gammaproteobacteria bacterium]
MNKFRELLEDLQTGQQNLHAVEDWISAQLTEDRVDADTLLKILDSLPGLDADTTRQLAEYIETTNNQHKTDADTGVDISHLKLAPIDEPRAKKDIDSEVSEAKTEFQADAEVPDDNSREESLEKTIAARNKKPAAPDEQNDTPDKIPAPGSGDPSEDETIIADDAPTTRANSQGSESVTHPSNTTGATGTSWPTQGTGGHTGSTQIGPGTILKERFELITAIGEGGMGTVYKARDLLKVEAKDRNPFIAVKLLSGDFKQHPEAFISLQRETSKAQKLAHPNVATVYDFDRDGSTVFMTMELLEGQELAKFIRKLPPGGLPAEEALAHIKQLCDGLAYAHDSGLVHSDLKPGNAYLTRDKSLKLLDFGIARASKTRSDASGEITLFDPSQLGALTPAYATIEMFEGSEPDPRDDIYALACISYELLSGKHPYNKLSAVKVKQKGLTPSPIPKLTKRQNRALREALTVERNERTASVDAFWEGLRPRKDYTWYYLGGSVAAVALVGL